MINLAVLRALIAGGVQQDKLADVCQAIDEAGEGHQPKRRRRREISSKAVSRRRVAVAKARRRSGMTALPGGEAAE